MAAPSKLFSVDASSNVGLEMSRNVICTVVTGIDLQRFCYKGCHHHPGDCFHKEVYTNSLQHPDYSSKTTRLLSFKYWGGLVSPRELAEAGFYMIAPRDVVKCFSCSVVIRDWRKGDVAIDIHRLRSPNCEFFSELLSEIANNETRDTPGTSSCSEELLIQGERIEEVDSGVEIEDDDEEERTVLVKKCIMCNNENVEYFFLPCGHARTCEDCATRMFNSGQTCCVCSQTVANIHPICF